MAMGQGSLTSVSHVSVHSPRGQRVQSLDCLSLQVNRHEQSSEVVAGIVSGEKCICIHYQGPDQYVVAVLLK